MAKTAVGETLADKVLDALGRAPDGLTDFELAHHTGAFLSSVNSTRNSLVKLGLIASAGKTRLSGRGGSATVWVYAN